MKTRLMGATFAVLACCVGVRIGAALVAPILPALIVIAVVVGILWWLVRH
jgi:hypothetical protein